MAYLSVGEIKCEAHFSAEEINSKMKMGRIGYGPASKIELCTC